MTRRHRAPPGGPRQALPGAAKDGHVLETLRSALSSQRRPGRRWPTFLLVLFHTVTRSEETRAMKWSGLDFERSIWTIPPEASKTGGLTGEPHLVPLSRGALDVLEAADTAKV